MLSLIAAAAAGGCRSSFTSSMHGRRGEQGAVPGGECCKLGVFTAF